MKLIKFGDIFQKKKRSFGIHGSSVIDKLAVNVVMRLFVYLGHVLGSCCLCQKVAASVERFPYALVEVRLFLLTCIKGLVSKSLSD